MIVNAPLRFGGGARAETEDTPEVSRSLEAVESETSSEAARWAESTANLPRATAEEFPFSIKVLLRFSSFFFFFFLGGCVWWLEIILISFWFFYICVWEFIDLGFSKLDID